MMGVISRSLLSGDFNAFKSEQYGTCFCRENGAVILNAMTIAMVNEDCWRLLIILYMVLQIQLVKAIGP